MDVWPPAPLEWPPAPLTDGAVWLDRLGVEDASAIAGAIDQEILHWLPLPSPYQESDALSFLSTVMGDAEAGRSLTFAVRNAADRVLAGAASLHFRGGRGVAEVGYWVGPSARGRGVAARATRLLGRHAVAAFGAHRVELLIQPGNVASRRAAERAGATYEGVRRAGIEQRGEVLDAAIYSLLPLDLAEE